MERDEIRIELASATIGRCETLLKILSPPLGKRGQPGALPPESQADGENLLALPRNAKRGDDAILSALDAYLRRQELEIAREASVALLLTFVELLATFIGERLTWQLLQEAWPDILTVPSKEKKE